MSELVAKLRPYRWNLVGLLLGALLGLTYAHFIGCPRGGCAITSSRILSTLFGGLVGAAAFSPRREPPPAEKPREA